MSVLSTKERYLLSGHVSVTEDVPQRPRSIHLRLTADSLSKIAERGDEDILKIFDVDKDEGFLYIGNDQYSFSRTVEANPYQIYKHEQLSRGEGSNLHCIGNVSAKLSLRQEKQPSTTAFTKLKERREEENARKSEHRAVLLPSAPATTKTKITSLKLLPKSRTQTAAQLNFSQTTNVPSVETDQGMRSAKTLTIPKAAATTITAKAPESIHDRDDSSDVGKSSEYKTAEKAASRSGSKNTTKHRLTKAAKGRALPAKPVPMSSSTASAKHMGSAATKEAERKGNRPASDRVIANEQLATPKSKNVTIDYTDSEDEGDTKPKTKAANAPATRQGVGRGALMVKEPWLDIRSAREWHELARRFKRIYDEYKLGLDHVQSEEVKLRRDLDAAKAETMEGRRNSIRTRSASRNSNIHATADDEEREEGEAEPGEYSERLHDPATVMHAWRGNGAKNGSEDQSGPLSVDELDDLVTSVCELEGQLRRMKTALRSTSFEA